MNCDGCTLCCYLLDIPWMNSPSGKQCKNCLPDGCSLYPNIPKDCMAFRCAYNQMKKCDVKFRPDKCHIIFEKMSNNMMYGTQDPRYKISDIAKKQISAFHREGMTVIINDKNKLKITPKHGSNIKEEFRKYKKLLEERNG